MLINNVAKPNEAFTFEGGSIVEFKEAPVSGQTVKYYSQRSGGDNDVVLEILLIL